MRVRYLGYTADGQQRASNALTVGRDYVVLSMTCAEQRGTSLQLLVDREPRRPAWFPAAHFDVVSNEVPSTWRIAVGNGGSAGSVTVAPASWLERGFFEDYWGDGDAAAIAAQDVFEHELATILRES